jgi:hypothetical protein
LEGLRFGCSAKSDAQPIIPPDLGEKRRRPVNSNVCPQETSSVHPYLQETEYAVRGLFDLIGDEELRCSEVRHQLGVEREERAYAQSILYVGAPPTGFGEDTTRYFEKRARDAKRKIQALEASALRLEAAIAAKAFSVRALAGSILQVAKQGIVVGQGSFTKCPLGRQVGNQSLKNVVWQARNQAMHWEEATFNQAVTLCFQNLEQSFGSRFRLNGTVAVSLAKEVIDLLQWTNYDSYANDMQSLIQ